MSFTSLGFLCFLPAVTALYWLCPRRWRWAVLLAASYGFYMSWAPWTGLLLAGATLLSWLAGRLDLLAVPLLLCCPTLLEGTPLPTGRGSLRGETRWALTLYYLLTAILLGWLLLLAGDGETAFLYFQF